VIDAKEIFTEVLDAPPSPPPPAEQVIRIARRAMRRAWLARLGLATAVVVAAAVAVPRIPWGPTRTEPAEPTPVPTFMSDTSALLDRFAAVISAALPGDVLANPGGGEGSRDPGTGELEVVGMFVNVERSGEHGQVMAFWVAQPRPVPSGDLCAVPWPDPLVLGGTDESCRTIDVGGVAVRVGVRTDVLLVRSQVMSTEPVTVPYAIHYLAGALVLVAVLPSNNSYIDSRPMLTSPVLTERQLAELATDWRLTPIVAPPPQ
jgi:hypothetical protein